MIYTELGQSSECDGEPVTGPHHCSFFEWRMPDTSSTEATLDHFEIYNKDGEDSTLIASVNDTTFIIGEGYANDLYVVAVYSSPEGYSNSSNVVTSEGIPLEIRDIDINLKPLVYYNSLEQSLLINSSEEVASVSIYDIKGRLVIEQIHPSSILSLESFTNGVYIVILRLNNNTEIKEKIIK
jgi:hypothetical protein